MGLENHSEDFVEIGNFVVFDVVYKSLTIVFEIELVSLDKIVKINVVVTINNEERVDFLRALKEEHEVDTKNEEIRDNELDDYVNEVGHMEVKIDNIIVRSDEDKNEDGVSEVSGVDYSFIVDEEDYDVNDYYNY